METDEREGKRPWILDLDLATPTWDATTPASPTALMLNRLGVERRRGHEKFTGGGMVMGAVLRGGGESGLSPPARPSTAEPFSFRQPPGVWDSGVLAASAHKRRIVCKPWRIPAQSKRCYTGGRGILLLNRRHHLSCPSRSPVNQRRRTHGKVRERTSRASGGGS